MFSSVKQSVTLHASASSMIRRDRSVEQQERLQGVSPFTGDCVPRSICNASLIFNWKGEVAEWKVEKHFTEQC